MTEAPDSYGTSRTGRTLHTLRPARHGGTVGLVAYCGALMPRPVALTDADGMRRCDACAVARNKARRTDAATAPVVAPVPAPVAAPVPSLSELRATLAAVPSADVAAAVAWKASRDAQDLRARGRDRTFGRQEIVRPVDATDIDATLTIPNVYAVVRDLMVKRSGRVPALTDILPDGVSTVADVAQDAYATALETIASLIARAGDPADDTFITVLGNVRRRKDGSRTSQYGTTRGAWITRRASRCGKCEECAEMNAAHAHGAAVSRDVARTRRGRAVVPFGRSRTPNTVSLPSRWTLGDCSAPVMVEDVITVARAAIRAIYVAADKATTAVGTRRIKREDGTRERVAPRVVSLDNEATPAATVALADARMADSNMSGEADDLRAMMIAVLVEVCQCAPDSDRNACTCAQSSNGISAPAWQAITRALGTSPNRRGQEDARARLQSVRAGRATLASVRTVAPVV